MKQVAVGYLVGGGTAIFLIAGLRFSWESAFFGLIVGFLIMAVRWR